MSENVDSPLSAVLQRRFGAALTEFQEMQNQAASGRIDPTTGQPALNLRVFAQMVLDIARQANEVNLTGRAVVNEFVERGLIKVQ